MPTRLQAACDAFEVSVEQPRRGDRELRIEVVFAPGGPTDRAVTELRLYARRLGWVIRRERNWDTEASVPGTKAILERGETGRLVFTRPLPAFVAPYRGELIELGVVLFTRGDDGSTVRLLLDAPPVAEDAWLVVRGLPHEERLRAERLRDRLRRRRPRARFEAARDGAVSVTVVDPLGATGGRVRLEAAEYEWHDGSGVYFDPPIVTTEAPLAPAGAGRLRAELPLPAATVAPASIECTLGGGTIQGVRWRARFALEDGRGRIAGAYAPLHVGVERPPDG